MMKTVEEAKALVSYAKFPVPRGAEEPGNISGVRGVGSPFAPAAFRQSMAEYMATANKNVFVAVQIETVDGLNNCEEIAKVDGIGEVSRFQRVHDSLPFSDKQTCFSSGLYCRSPEVVLAR